MLELPPHDEAEHQLQESLTEKHALDRLDSPEAEVIGAPASGDYRNKQRRKANERPTVCWHDMCKHVCLTYVKCTKYLEAHSQHPKHRPLMPSQHLLQR